MQLQQLLEAMIAYMGGDARRIQHFIKVHALAQLIGRQEQLNERTQFILEAAALTHDIGIKNGEAKFGAGKCSGKTQELEGPPAAAEPVSYTHLIIVCGFFTLLNPLIELWLGKQFLFDEVVVTWLIINFYLTYMRMAVNAFKDASGLYWNDRYKPLAESVINLIASVYLTIHYGVIGVIWGGIISTLLTCFWVCLLYTSLCKTKNFV